MEKDRRLPLGGVKKETFVHSATCGNPQLSAELIYDLVAGVKSDLCYEIREVKEGVCTLDDIRTDSDKRYIRKAFPKIPVSISEFVAYFFIVGVLVGLGVLNWKSIKLWF